MLDSTRGLAMFLRRYTRTKDGKQHTYYALVESVRTDAGPRQQVVAYLGELNHDQQRRWQRTVVFHNRQGESQQLRLFTDDNISPGGRKPRRIPYRRTGSHPGKYRRVVADEWSRNVFVHRSVNPAAHGRC